MMLIDSRGRSSPRTFRRSLERGARRQRGGLSALVLCGFFAVAGCGADDVTVVDAEKGNAGKGAPTWEQFRDSARYVSEAGAVSYVVEGDIALDEEGLRRVYNRSYVEQIDKSTVLTSGGSDVVWLASEKLNITYCIADSWGSQKAQALADMREATAMWQSAANVQFVYVPSQDAACSETNTGVKYNVIPWTGGGLTCAPRGCHYLKMNYAANFGNYSWLGAWTHEVGHALGLWHEHLRAECGVNEGVTIRALTGYDSMSSLHYDTVCGSQSTGQMTVLDKQGLASLYGAPASPILSVSPAMWIGVGHPSAVD